MRHLCILGSTGSIGLSTLDVVRRNQDRYNIVSLAAHSNVKLMFEQCQTYQPQKVVMVSHTHAEQLKALIEQHQMTIEVLSGEEALVEIATDSSTDTVMAAIVGRSWFITNI